MSQRARPPRYTAQIAMRLYTLPLLALFAIGAQAASLPRHAVAVTDLEKKLTKVVEEVLKEDVKIDNHSSEQELIEEVNAVSDIDNQLKKVPGIPVKVIAEENKPALKKDYGIEKGDGISDVNTDSIVKRQEADLAHPGEPQRQEHDTQSPEDSNTEQQTISAIKQSFAETQNVFKQGFDGLSTKFRDVFQTNDQLVTIQKSLENLQKSFSKRFEEINETLQGYFSAAKPTGESSPNKQVAIEMEKRIEDIEEKVESDIKSLTKVVPEVASVRGESSSGGSYGSIPSGGSVPSEGSIPSGGSVPSGGSIPSSGSIPSGGSESTESSNPFAVYLTQFQTQMQEQLNNFQTNVQNYFNQGGGGGTGGDSGSTPGSGSGGNFIENIQSFIGQQNQINQGATQSDEATQRPTIWEGIQSSFTNIFRPGQQQQQGSQTQDNVQSDTPAAPSTAAPNRPIVQAIQNNPIYQGVVNLIRPTTKAPTVVVEDVSEQAQTAEKPAESAQEGSNAVPDADKPAEASPVKDDKAPTQTVAPAIGPIQQIVQRNPIVQGISSAVQRIQNTIGGNTEKPREIEIRGHKPGYGSGTGMLTMTI